MPFWIHSFSSPKIISKIISGWQRLLALTYSDKIHTYNTDNVTKKISTLNISNLVYIVIDSRAEPIHRLLTYKACILLKYNKEKGYDSQFWAGFLLFEVQAANRRALEGLIVNRLHILRFNQSIIRLLYINTKCLQNYYYNTTFIGKIGPLYV